ncbi:GMC oxidoreductase [Saccharata proteae CBS 121410]|uniref:GMC oxidoreductase n=1 Tax=Saccharata proteae CBS 121410 TaxID=1314787 RepID=A0A9P4HXR5_9PEZI|nr:GMC oxidoreductase [Saccharata proteae CBS 121410]
MRKFWISRPVAHISPDCASSTASVSGSLVQTIDDYTVKSILKGNGLVTGTLGALAGAAGVEATYDYVVIGGGTGGNAIGTRLAEAGFSVAILEAGEYYEIGKPVLGTTPAGDIVGIGADIADSDPLVDWEFVTQPQPGVNDREVHYTRGKCLGGSSALNYMIYQRGTKGSYDMWADLVNDSSYTWDNILPYFKKSVSFTPPNTEKRLANATTEYNEDAFGDGPVQVGFTNYVSPFATWLQKVVTAVGIDTIVDFNSGSLIGSQYSATTIRASDQTRSTSETYINSVNSTDNQNLKVYTGTLAKKILFNSNKTATGVEVESAAITYKIHASKEVILSAGSFQSPQLLMVSGIGPKETLQQFDIDVISDLPGVGQNMWDHVMFGPAYEVNMNTLDRVLHDPLALAQALTDYVTVQEGPLTSNVVEFIGWEKLPEEYRSNFSASTQQALSEFSDDWPEVEWISGNGYIGNFRFPALQQPLNEKQYGTILGALVSPKSRGNVTISSASTSDLPLVSPNWLTDPADIELAIAMFKRQREMWKTAEMQSVVIGDEYWPGVNVTTDEEILAVIKDAAMTVWHASCTNKMGTADDEMAVVDNETRVFGVEGLRVVDASAMPILPPGHPTSTIYMLAEKIADSIISGQS